jgi:phosphatidate cytidylyltransferase
MAGYLNLSRVIPTMLVKRILAALALAVVGIPAIIFGGHYFVILITLLLGIAAWEYGRMFRLVDFNASEPLLVGGVVLVAVVRHYFPDYAAVVFSLLILAAMTWHLVDYERGRDRAATDFAVTAGGIIYIGWIGAYLIDLRFLTDGLWWILYVLPAIWFADTAAYFIGSRFGKRRLSPRLSPKKSWEGYLAGVLFSTVGTAGLTVLWHSLGGPDVMWWQGAALGAMLSILTLLGDLGESMFKRQAGVKDSSNIIPGHGGVFDRMDSWLWGGVLGYYFIVWFLIH